VTQKASPEQALPTDTAADAPNRPKYSNQIVKTHVATPKGEGWEGTKAAAVPTRARRQAAVFMVRQSRGSSNVLLAALVLVLTTVGKRDQSKCVMPAYDSSSLNASFLPAKHGVKIKASPPLPP